MRTSVLLSVSCLLFCSVNLTDAEGPITRRPSTTTIKPKKYSVKNTTPAPKKVRTTSYSSSGRSISSRIIPTTRSTPPTTTVTEATTESTTMESTTVTTTTTTSDPVTSHFVMVFEIKSNSSSNSTAEENSLDAEAAESTKITRIVDEVQVARPTVQSYSNRRNLLRQPIQVSHEINHSIVSNVSQSKCLLQGIRCRNNSITCYGSGDIDCYLRKCSLAPSQGSTLFCNPNLDEAGCTGRGVCVNPSSASSSVLLSAASISSSPLTTTEVAIVGVSISLGLIVLISTCVYVYVTMEKLKIQPTTLEKRIQMAKQRRQLQVPRTTVSQVSFNRH